MNKLEAKARMDAIEKEIHAYVEKRLEEIEAICNETGMIYYMGNVGPFEYGNAGAYYPVNDDGQAWYDSDSPEWHGAYGEDHGWISSSQRCD